MRSTGKAAAGNPSQKSLWAPKMQESLIKSFCLHWWSLRASLGQHLTASSEEEAQHLEHSVEVATAFATVHFGVVNSLGFGIKNKQFHRGA